MSSPYQDYIVVIPARAGSERIIDKNNKLVGDYTLVEWAIKCALTLFDKNQIVLVTDSERSSSSGDKYGVRILSRPPEISKPSSSTESLIRHVMQNYRYGKYVLLQPTSPFRTRSDLQSCIDVFEMSNARSVMSVTLPWNPPKDLYSVSEELKGSFKPQKVSFESDGQVYFDTGAVYVFDAQLIEQGKPIFDTAYTQAVQVNQMAFFDIDYEFHLQLANAFYQLQGWILDR